METKRATTAEVRYRAAAGAVFRRLREERHWSLRDFGERVHAAHTTLYAVERGETTPGIDVLDRVAAAVELDLSALLSLIIDQLQNQQDRSGDTLPELVLALARLTDQQRAEAIRFIEFLSYRDSSVRTD